MNFDWVTAHVGMPLLKILILLIPVFTVVAYMVWFERRVLGFFQSRLGPNRVGPLGLIQPIADGLKLLLKEDVVPANARPFLFKVAPVFSFFPAFVGFSVITWALPWVTASGKTHGFVVADVDLGLLVILALSSMGIFGILLGGWSSGSKYPLFGSLRSASQMLAYEVPLTFSVLSVFLLAGSFRMSDIVAAQQRLGWYFLFPGIVAFGVYVVAAVAETNRTPFDLPEGESEIIGFHTEYSGMRFAFYFVAEYANVVLTSVLAAALFLGGYDIPFVNDAALYAAHPALTSILGVTAFAVKGAVFAFFFVWIRATWPRYRYDQLLKIGWFVLFPLALVNLLLSALFRLWLLR